MPRRETSLGHSSKFDLTTAELRRLKLAAPASPQVGDSYGRYQLLHPIAEGGMATVWLARMRSEHGFDRTVALKTILPSLARDLRFRNMFLDEARIASRIEHPNVARVFDFGEQDENLYLVMEWVNGDSLSNLLRVAEADGYTLPLPVLLRIFADVCAGLHAAHELRDQSGREMNVVHRDVSPQNILVSDAGLVKVIDFGVAKARGRVAEETSIGVVKGKLQYMAPERVLGADVDHRADVWAVGAILYRILAGRPPYEGSDKGSIIRQLLAQDPVRALPSRVPHALARVVYKALAGTPNERYGAMAELQEEFEGLLHRFDSPTTSRHVAGVVSAVLGPSLAARRAAIDRAIERQDQTVTIRYVPHADRPHVILLRPVAPSSTSSSRGIEILRPTDASRGKRSSPVRALPEVSRELLAAAPDPVSPVPSRQSIAPAVPRWRLRSRRSKTALFGAWVLVIVAAVFGVHLGSTADLGTGSPMTSTPGAPFALPASHSPAPPLVQLTAHTESQQPPLPQPSIVRVNDLALEHKGNPASRARPEWSPTTRSLSRHTRLTARPLVATAD
ncbi:MAG TPA: serine/threonine-protein kinase [Polyangiaceae bacterium]|nr:serine/threonine-protein kinase [Polyangiaceae bacterium]